MCWFVLVEDERSDEIRKREKLEVDYLYRKQEFRFPLTLEEGRTPLSDQSLDELVHCHISLAPFFLFSTSVSNHSKTT